MYAFLIGLAGRMNESLHVRAVGPGVEHLAFELRAVIHRNRSPASHGCPPSAAAPPSRGVPVIEVFDLQCQHTLSCSHPQWRDTGCVGHRPKPSETKSIDQLRFAAVGFRQRLALEGANAFTLTPPHCQARFPIQAGRSTYD